MEILILWARLFFLWVQNWRIFVIIDKSLIISWLMMISIDVILGSKTF